MNRSLRESPPLPVQTTPFAGRWDALSQIADRFADPHCRLLTLVGPGGIGKTRLALQAATILAGLPDQVYFVALQPLDSAKLIVNAVNESLGLPIPLGSEPKAQLLQYLRGKALLLILDNFEHLLEGTPLISQMLAQAPGVKLLATSRERLNLREEWVFEVRGLPFPPPTASTNAEDYSAVHLFAQNAQRVNSNFILADEIRAVTRICQLVEGTPLALELASSWVHVLSSTEIAEEIERGLDILSTNARDAPARHQNMRVVLDHSWNRLSQPEREVFQRLTVFRGGFRRDAAEQVAGASRSTLAALVEKSWLRHDTAGRYDIHELLRQYGEEALVRGGDQKATSLAHSAYYATFLEQRWRPLRTEQQIRVLDEIESEFENVRTAWLVMVEQRQIAELSQSIYSLWLFCDLRGRFYDALTLFQQAEEALRPAGKDAMIDRVLGQLLTRLGWFYVTLSKLEAGRALTETGLALLQRVGSAEDVALGFYSLSCLDAFRNDPPALRQDAEQMAAIARSLDDRLLLAMALFPRANAALKANNLAEAQQFGQEALALAEACGDVWLRAMGHGVLSGIAEEHGTYSDALHHAEQSLKLLEALGQTEIIGSMHHVLGSLALHMNDYPRAAAHYQQSLKLLSGMSGVTNHVIEAVLKISRFWSFQARKLRAVELLTLVVLHPQSLSAYRAEAEQMLGRLRAELATTHFSLAQQRGQQLELNQVVQELIVELGRLSQESRRPDDQGLVEPLTKREWEVLRLLMAGLSNQSIAQKLIVSVGTVKAHTSSIYSKLGVSNRAQAVVQAHKLGLF